MQFGHFSSSHLLHLKNTRTNIKHWLSFFFFFWSRRLYGWPINSLGLGRSIVECVLSPRRAIYCSRRLAAHRVEKREATSPDNLLHALMYKMCKNTLLELSNWFMSMNFFCLFLCTRATPDGSDETCHIRWHRPQLKGRIKPGLGDLFWNLWEMLCVHCQTLWQTSPLSTFTC